MKGYADSREKRRCAIRGKLAAYSQAIRKAKLEASEAHFISLWHRPEENQSLVRAAWQAVSEAAVNSQYDWLENDELTRELKSHPGAHFFFNYEILSEQQIRSQQVLRARNLPELTCLSDLCNLIQIPAMRLAWLVAPPQNKRRLTRKSLHYSYTWIPKHSGGERLLEIPKPELMEVQRQIDRKILSKIPSHDSAHGFVSDTGTKSNAAAHVRSDRICKMDLLNFFPSISDRRIERFFISLGYPQRVASMIALTCTHQTHEVAFATQQRDSNDYHQADFRQRHLPQGAPSSPKCANAVAFRMDSRLDGLARSLGMKYTRYADDLTFSAIGNASQAFRQLIPVASKIIEDCGFRVNSRKTRILGRHVSQRICGVVTNEKTNAPRRTVDILRSAVHRQTAADTSSPDNEYSATIGRIAYVTHLNPSLTKRVGHKARTPDLQKKADDAEEIKVTVEGTTYHQTGEVAHKRTDGLWTELLIWEARCLICEQTFEHKSPRGYNAAKFPRKCRTHRNVKKVP